MSKQPIIELKWQSETQMQGDMQTRRPFITLCSVWGLENNIQKFEGEINRRHRVGRSGIIVIPLHYFIYKISQR